jgi:hypothetical protein
VASNGSGTAGKRTRNKRKTRFLAARSRATFSSSLAQSPTPFGPMKKPQADEARSPAASSSCHLPPGVRHHLSSHGSSPACFNFVATRSTAGLSRLYETERCRNLPRLCPPQKERPIHPFIGLERSNFTAKSGFWPCAKLIASPCIRLRLLARRQGEEHSLNHGGRSRKVVMPRVPSDF